MKLSTITGIQPEIRTFQKSKLFPTNDFIGLEIELEGWRHGVDDFHSDFWKVKHDDSLRDNGMEFVFNFPLNGKDIEKALKEFEVYVKEYEKKYDIKISCSERSSIHVHLDVREFYIKQLFSLAQVFATCEPSLFKIFGIGREDSNYCLPLFKSTDKTRFSRVLQKGNSRGTMCDLLKSSKYSSFNTASILNFGSVEFRMHYGTTDTKKIANWISVLLMMKQYAKNLKWEASTFSGNVSKMGSENFLTEIFEDRVEQFLYPGFQEDVLMGIRVAQDMALRLKLEDEHYHKTSQPVNLNPMFKKLTKKLGKAERAEEIDVCQILKSHIGIDAVDIINSNNWNWNNLGY